MLCEKLMKMPGYGQQSTIDSLCQPTSLVVNLELFPQHKRHYHQWEGSKNDPVPHPQFTHAPHQIDLKCQLHRALARRIRPNLQGHAVRVALAPEGRWHVRSNAMKVHICLLNIDEEL